MNYLFSAFSSSSSSSTKQQQQQQPQHSSQPQQQQQVGGNNKTSTTVLLSNNSNNNTSSSAQLPGNTNTSTTKTHTVHSPLTNTTIICQIGPPPVVAMIPPPTYDIEEATPPVSSQRYDASRRRPNAAAAAAAGTSSNSEHEYHNHHHHSNPLSMVPSTDDDVRSVISLPKAPLSTGSARSILRAISTASISGGGSGGGVNVSGIGPLPLTVNNLQSSQGSTGGSTNPSSSNSNSNNNVIPEPKLIHPILYKCPLQFRFIMNGILSNVIFMIVYNKAVFWFIHMISASTIYSIVYLIYIPFGHFTANLLVFGWPDHYCQSLVNNFPIGLTAIAIGSLLTAYLDQIHFNDRVENYIYNNWTFHKMPPITIQQQQQQQHHHQRRMTGSTDNHDDSSSSEFYSSLVVLFVTSIWTYVLSIWVNRYPTKSEKKEL